MSACPGWVLGVVWTRVVVVDLPRRRVLGVDRGLGFRG